MQGLVVFTAVLACAAAAPGLLVAHHPVVATVHPAPVLHAAVPVVASKTTITSSSQHVNHGSPVAHAVHTPIVAAVHSAPIIATPVVHAAPVVHAPVLIRTAPSAVAHSSSVVHHSPIKTLPIIAVH